MGNISKLGRGLLTLLLVIVLAAAAKAQEPSGKPASGSSSSQGTSTLPKDRQKFSLLDATRVSTEEAARSAAPKAAEKSPTAAAAESSSDSTVTEFHPARPDSAPTGDSAVTTSGESRKSTLKRVHGTVYGSAAPGNPGGRRGGAAVGAASKSGKTHVYVETDRSRTDTPH